MGIIELVKEHLIEDAKKEGMEKGMEKGLEKGMSQGEVLKARKVAIAMINQFPAMGDEEIARIIEMSIVFVQQIRKEMNAEQQ